MEDTTHVNGVDLWYRITGEGEPVFQIHGAGFGHFNFDPCTPELAKHFQVVDYDMRGYGASARPVQDYDMEVWADDLAGLMDALEIDQAHVHGTSMGGMIAIVFAGKYPARTRSVVINCAAAKLGASGRLIFKNWIDIARLDPEGPGSRLLAELITWQALSKRFLEEQDAGACDNPTPDLLLAECEHDLLAETGRTDQPGDDHDRQDHHDRLVHAQEDRRLRERQLDLRQELP